MALYELAVFDPSDPVLDPMWRQGMFVIPFMNRLGITNSWGGWNITGGAITNPGIWSYEGVAGAHIVFSGLCFLAAIWHWVYWDLEIFCDERTGKPSLDLPKIFGIHLFLAGVACFGFGAFHVTGLYGPGIWVSDPYGLTGRIQSVNPAWGVEAFVVAGTMCFYDYIGNNPAKGGLFRAGSMDNGDGIAVGWLGHPIFRDKEGHELFVRRMPTFFETFPVVLVDGDGIVRADVPFRRAESKYSVEQVGVTVEFYGGELNGISYSDPTTVKKYARRAQLGEIFELDRATLKSDGVFRSSPRGWFTFGHASFALLFFFGHIWHGARTLFRDVFAGIDPDLDAQVEFGAFQKLGDPTTRRQAIADDITSKYVPPHVNIFYCLGGITLTCFLVQVATGFAMTFYYRPTVTEAFASVQYIMTEANFGWLIRSVHRWSATSFGVTGYSLPWDQIGYWAVKIVTGVPEAIPVIGSSLNSPIPITKKPDLNDPVLRAKLAKGMGHNYYGEPAWPNDLLYIFPVVILGTIACNVGLAVLEPSMIGEPADPFATPLEILPEWYFFPVFQILRTVPNKLLGVLLMVSVPTGLLTVPFLENVNKFQNPFRRPVATTIFLIGTVVALWLGIGATLPIEKSLTLGLF
ncbi:hypothetical protein VNO80_35257 [Phaseolus coccineus]|uniref:Cytochrome b n=1 Tax=Phaseolus coccineus TaxID=3886 RepID=A0AAN9KQF8_PHACN